MNKLICACLLLVVSPLAGASDYIMVIRDHRFEPAELVVPSGEKIRLLITNHDGTPEEFESHALNREKIVAGNGQITLYVGPLEKGQYPFFGEFNQSTAQGVIVAR